MLCTRCGMSLKRAMLLALLEDAGAKCYPNSSHCDGEHEHDFADEVKIPRFEKTGCSHCGREFGPGDHGFSHCDQHPGYMRDRLLNRQAAARRGWETRRIRQEVQQPT